MGSCFADCMGARLVKHKFTTLSNPFGTVFNPHAGISLLWHSLRQQAPAANTYLNRADLYYNELFHSTFSSPHKSHLAQHIHATLKEVHQWLHQADWLILTWGTAFVYKNKQNNNIVSNCHKLPSRLFEKSLLRVEEIVAAFTALWKQLQTINPQLRVIVTVSPVRHIRDDLEMNMVSKSVLRLACHVLQDKFDQINYFPAYEIMMDDLRDYRFYTADLIHLNDMAEEYIWELFCKRYLDQEAQNFISTWKKVCKALFHKPFHPGTVAHQQFVQATLQQLHAINEQYGLDCSQEIIQMNHQLNA